MLEIFPCQYLFVYTISFVAVTFDPAKNRDNVRKHGVSLKLAERFDLDSAFFDVDDSQDYGEERYLAIGWVGGTLYSMVFTLTGEDTRVINLRKATREERALYAEAI